MATPAALLVSAHLALCPLSRASEIPQGQLASLLPVQPWEHLSFPGSSCFVPSPALVLWGTTTLAAAGASVKKCSS